MNIYDTKFSLAVAHLIDAATLVYFVAQHPRVDWQQLDISELHFHARCPSCGFRICLAAKRTESGNVVPVFLTQNFTTPCLPPDAPADDNFIDNRNELDWQFR